MFKWKKILAKTIGISNFFFLNIGAVLRNETWIVYFGYYYTINKLNFELIAMEETDEIFIISLLGWIPITRYWMKERSGAKNILLSQHYPAQAHQLLKHLKGYGVFLEM